MRANILILISLLGAIAWGEDSAYNKMRKSYKLASVQDNAQLQVGSLWYCSGSLEAAKGLFRYVPVWEPRFQFSEKSGAVANLGPREVGGVEMLEREWVTSSRNEFFRFSERGDMIVEVTRKSNETQGNSGLVEHRPSLSFPWRQAVAYLICENPQIHDDPDWHKRTIWVEDPRDTKSGDR